MLVYRSVYVQKKSRNIIIYLQTAVTKCLWLIFVDLALNQKKYHGKADRKSSLDDWGWSWAWKAQVIPKDLKRETNQPEKQGFGTEMFLF